MLYANGVSITGENTGDSGGANTVSKVHVPVSDEVVGCDKDGLVKVTEELSLVVLATDGRIGS